MLVKKIHFSAKNLFSHLIGQIDIDNNKFRLSIMSDSETIIECNQLIIFVVPDDGIPQTFIKRVDDYTELLRESIRDYTNHKSKRAA